ncbi:SDR family NAD(P)-dependent oxidoreductase [Moheibacter sediminis]|uniref:NADP-dependent 3-hydroxy acid dehydrogenase YdfG n=1 Tax=Moheibacter sediminis TaxID=1434700 RepID=A0A1W2B113_9FLAO|nr:SDR family NAD(P)-dependent oxidoreductase [Moheibacter sediminis]SMC66098.1 NADP-dependent 3-hydroxy acid dehydrogenase YdfG [Moheibacter sediminis]
MKTALITGATSGIGMETTRKLSNDFRLIICGRRQERLDELKSELSKNTEVFTLNFDVRDKIAVFNAIENLPENFRRIDVLLNNAGNAHGLAPFQDADLEDLEAMIDGNVKGIIYTTKAVLPLMIPNGSGHIINISSIAGKQVYANGTTYCASKWAVEALSKGMRLDLLPLGIKVTNVAPGAVDTEFSLVRFKGDEHRSQQVYSGFQPLSAKNIAETIYFAIMQPDHVQLADITILPKAQADGTSIHRN